jgi:N utilization substance protein B
MINRRNIRIKALQVVYSAEMASVKPSSADVKKDLKNKFVQTSSLLNYCVSLLTECCKYVEVFANQRASKHLPTAEDLAVNTKLAGNDFVWQLMANKSFVLACEDTKTDKLIDAVMVKKLFLSLEPTDVYKQYIATNSRSKEEDTAIVQYIWNELILADEEWIAHLTERYQNFDDDIEMLLPIIKQAIEKGSSVKFTKYMTADKEQYANSLVNDYYEKYETVTTYIKPKLKNWDLDRVAKLDMILLHLGVAELLYYETIPVKVTINEYIDIAKEYSTPLSGQFVNGILDGIHKDLVRDDKLYKVDFRKF